MIVHRGVGRYGYCSARGGGECCACLGNERMEQTWNNSVENYFIPVTTAECTGGKLGIPRQFCAALKFWGVNGTSKFNLNPPINIS